MRADRSSKDEQILIRLFCENIGIWRPVRSENYILFRGDNSWIIAFKQIKFRRVKYHGYTYKFKFNHYFL